MEQDYAFYCKIRKEASALLMEVSRLGLKFWFNPTHEPIYFLDHCITATQKAGFNGFYLVAYRSKKENGFMLTWEYNRRWIETQGSRFVVVNIKDARKTLNKILSPNYAQGNQ